MSLDLSPGTVFAGDYKVVRALDSGGMGSVFIVEQISTGNQRALKLMHPTLVANEKLRERFLLEAKVGSRIQSDHVVQVIAAGVDAASNSPWLVMELLQGEELEKRVRSNGPLPRPVMLEVMRQLCHALAAAHNVGVVHRDLKPNNIFLAKSRASGAPFMLKVLDFGIAKILAEAQTASTHGMGTPLWMAPEQTEARGRVGAGTDIWALGLLAYWMLTGNVYWVSGMQPNTNAQAVLRELLMEPIVPASVRAHESGVIHLLPPGFDGWFAMCVDRNLDKRFANADQALNAFVRMMEQPVAAIVSAQTRAGSPVAGAMGTSAQAVSVPGPHWNPGAYPAAGPSPPYPHQNQQLGQQQPGQQQYVNAQSGPVVNGFPGPAGSSLVTPPGVMRSGYGPDGRQVQAGVVTRGGKSPLVWVGIAVVGLGVIGSGIYLVATNVGSGSQSSEHRSHDDDDDDDRPKRRDHSSSSKGPDDDHDSKRNACSEAYADWSKLQSDLALLKQTQDNPVKLRAASGLADSTATKLDAIKTEDSALQEKIGNFATGLREQRDQLRGMADAIEEGNLLEASKLQSELSGAEATLRATGAEIEQDCRSASSN